MSTTPTLHQALLQRRYGTFISFDRTKKSLSITLDSLQESNELMICTFIKDITKKLQIASHIRSLSIRLHHISNRPCKSFDKIIPLIKSIKRLDKLTIKIEKEHDCYTNYLPMYLQTIKKILQTHKELRKFELKVPSAESDPRINLVFGVFLVKLSLIAPSITHFKLGYQNFALEDRKFLPSKVKHLKRIRNFALDLQLSFRWEEPKVVSVHRLRNFRNLKELTIHLFPNEREEVALIGSIKPYLRNLERFKVCYRNTSAWCYWYRNFIFTVLRMSTLMPKLKNLALDLKPENKASSEQILHALITDLSSLKINRLTLLNFNLTNLTFNPEIISQITSLLSSPSLRTLQAFSLKLLNCESFSDSVMNILGETIIHNLTDLRRLDLKLALGPSQGSSQLVGSSVEKKGSSNSKYFTGKGLAQFGKLLAQDTMSLESFSLDILNCSRISKSEIRKFQERLSALQGLKKMHLAFNK